MDKDGDPVQTPSYPAVPSRGAVTIKHLARAAGVSIATASKAFNGVGRMRQETRDRVLAVARAIDYQPNDLAHSLLRARSRTIGIISNDSFGRFTIPIVEALEERLADEGIAVFMCNATDDPARERQHLEQLLRKRIDGLVVTARRADTRPPIGPFTHGLPLVYVFTHANDPAALCLLPDDEGGAVLAVAHLAALGRRRIAHVTGPEHFEAVRLRRSGWRAALTAAGLPELPGFYLPGIWSEAWGREAVDELFSDAAAAPDALFCGNDQIARGAVDALRERGLDVPRDVAIVGFDNWDVMALAARPPLTSIDMNLRSLGREAGDRLLDMIDGVSLGGVVHRPCSLVVRESSAAGKGIGA